MFRCREPRCWQGCVCCSLLLSPPQGSPRASFHFHRREKSRRQLISWDCTKPLCLTSCPHPLSRLELIHVLLSALCHGLAPEKPAIFTLFFPCSALLRETPDPINPLSRTALSCSSSKAQLLFPVLSQPPPPVTEALSPPHVRSQ